MAPPFNDKTPFEHFEDINTTDPATDLNRVFRFYLRNINSVADIAKFWEEF